MAAEYDLNQFNSHKNIAIKEMWEKKVKIKQEHKMQRSSALTMPTFEPIYLKKIYTCRTWSLTKMGCQAYR
jgi:hypothetical protein